MSAGLQVWWGWTKHARPVHLDVFDAVERGRWERYRSESARAQFAVGCVIVRLVLAELTGLDPAELVIDRRCARCAGSHGKPRLVGSDLHFSVSHSGERVGVAFAEGPRVGLDVERVVEADRGSVAETVLAPEELRRWQGLGEAERTSAFHTYWARKESVLKATGDGLGVPMAELAVSAPWERPQLVTYPGGVELTVGMFDLDAGPGYAAALAVLGTPANLTIHDAVPLLTG